MNPELYREMAETQQKHWWFRARREILARVIARLKLPADAQLLEIGAGVGGNLVMLSQYGTVSAVEKSALARQLAAERCAIPIAHGYLPDALPFNDGSFDLICLFDVLEHVEDDSSALKRVYNLLKPGGRVVVTAPAYQWLYGAHDRAHHHFRRYTTAQLNRKALDAGFKVSRSGYYNAVLFPLIALARAQRITTGHRDTMVPNWLVNGILYAAFSLEKYIVPAVLFPYGTSVLAILVRDESHATDLEARVAVHNGWDCEHDTAHRDRQLFGGDGSLCRRCGER